MSRGAVPCSLVPWAFPWSRTCRVTFENWCTNNLNVMQINNNGQDRRFSFQKRSPPRGQRESRGFSCGFWKENLSFEKRNTIVSWPYDIVFDFLPRDLPFPPRRQEKIMYTSMFVFHDRGLTLETPPTTTLIAEVNAFTRTCTSWQP